MDLSQSVWFYLIPMYKRNAIKDWERASDESITRERSENCSEDPIMDLSQSVWFYSSPMYKRNAIKDWERASDESITRCIPLIKKYDR